MGSPGPCRELVSRWRGGSPRAQKVPGPRREMEKCSGAQGRALTAGWGRAAPRHLRGNPGAGPSGRENADMPHLCGLWSQTQGKREGRPGSISLPAALAWGLIFCPT